jgi:hypothetical protein
MAAKSKRRKIKIAPYDSADYPKTEAEKAARATKVDAQSIQVLRDKANWRSKRSNHLYRPIPRDLGSPCA